MQKKSETFFVIDEKRLQNRRSCQKSNDQEVIFRKVWKRFNLNSDFTYYCTFSSKHEKFDRNQEGRELQHIITLSKIRISLFAIIDINYYEPCTYAYNVAVTVVVAKNCNELCKIYFS